MLTLILLLSIGFSIFFYSKQEDLDRDLFILVAVPILVIPLFIQILLIASLISGLNLDSRIELYQSQNAEIESKIQATVASYLAHEKQAYRDLKPDNAIAVVSAYPELHSNELVKKQIEVYEDNNKKILGLKEEKLNQSVYKWWLYFGR
jgi:hypothetical protein|nr:MAG TPA: hypothetical protein [Caudoviricetes sp.]